MTNTFLLHLTATDPEGPWTPAGIVAPTTTFNPHLRIGASGEAILFFRGTSPAAPANWTDQVSPLDCFCHDRAGRSHRISCVHATKLIGFTILPTDCLLNRNRCVPESLRPTGSGWSPQGRISLLIKSPTRLETLCPMPQR